MKSGRVNHFIQIDKSVSVVASQIESIGVDHPVLGIDEKPNEWWVVVRTASGREYQCCKSNNEREVRMVRARLVDELTTELNKAHFSLRQLIADGMKEGRVGRKFDELRRAMLKD